MSTVPFNVTTPGPHRAMSTSARAWAGYQGGRDPYITMVSIYIFMPYVATVLVGNAVKGQAMIAAYSFIGGLIAALTATQPACSAITASWCWMAWKDASGLPNCTRSVA